MPSVLKGKHALVTGASRGIGRAITLGLVVAGVRVSALARSRDDLRSLCEQTDGAATPVFCDLADNAQLRETIDGLSDIDILINNAGFATQRTVLAAAREIDIDATIDTCLRAPIHLTRAMIHPMRERGGGAVVNILSIAARHGRAGESVYAAAKAGLRAFTEALREEVRDDGIRVCAVTPGLVDTTFVPPNKKVDRTLFLRTDDIARAVVQMLESPEHCCPAELLLEPQFTKSRNHKSLKA